jgi:hypothetical protein
MAPAARTLFEMLAEALVKRPSATLSAPGREG